MTHVVLQAADIDNDLLNVLRKRQTEPGPKKCRIGLRTVEKFTLCSNEAVGLTDNGTVACAHHIRILSAESRSALEGDLIDELIEDATWG